MVLGTSLMFRAERSEDMVEFFIEHATEHLVLGILGMVAEAV